MDLEIIFDAQGIAAAERRLRERLEADLPAIGKRWIGFKGGRVEHPVYSAGEGRLWYAYSKPKAGDTTPRHWNSFGILRESWGFQQIAVEASVPIAGDNARAAGFFARDRQSGGVYLMHSGRIGGGREGIGKSAFLKWLSTRPVQVRGPARDRTGLVIANLEDPGLVLLIWRFVWQVDRFKRQATNGGSAGAGDEPPALDPETERGGAGEKIVRHKKGTRAGAFDYFTYHDLVVGALMQELEAKGTPGEKVDDTQRVDLFVSAGGKWTQVYEVKTDCGRQSLYTAIGQLATHAPRPQTLRFLVLPAGEDLPSDCADTLNRLDIRVRRFSLDGSGMNTRVRLHP